MKSFLEHCAELDAPLKWWHVHPGTTFTLRAKSPVVTADSTIPQAKGKRGLFVSQQPWLWQNYGDSVSTHCTEITIPDDFTEHQDYYDGVAERFISNLRGITVGPTRRISDVMQELQ